ncbi:CotG/ExsB N-terminal domain-containing protein [Neobacillus massiliamazoniensis]|uniref:CotG/ExsB N-terminal domain-containing protein n=1 Tax=Neobacillus massiliamazoniensis TaxID=1499688 RepID=UPI003CCBF1AC
MEDFSSEDIQNAANEVRGTDFGDFMFRDPGFNRTSRKRTSRRITSRKQTSRRKTSRKQTTRVKTSRKRTSCRHTSRKRTSRRTTRRRPTECRRCVNTIQGNYQIERCWDGNNMSYFRMARR